MRLLLLILAAAMLCGCQATHLSKQGAIAIASQVALEHQEQLERYRSPKAHFYSASGLWCVSFDQTTPYTHGHPETYHYFAVNVDDKTGKGTYGAGVYR